MNHASNIPGEQVSLTGEYSLAVKKHEKSTTRLIAGKNFHDFISCGWNNHERKTHQIDSQTNPN